MGTQSPSSMLGSAVSSSTPKDFQPNSHMGVLGSCPLTNFHASSGCPRTCVAVGMQRALDSAIGLPSRSTSALWMLVFLMRAEVRRSLMLSPGVTCRRGAYSSFVVAVEGHTRTLAQVRDPSPG